MLRFRHPLIRAAVAERLPAVERGPGPRARRAAARRARPPAGRRRRAPAGRAARAGDPWATETLRAAALEAREPGRAGARRDLPAPRARRGLAGPRDPCRAPARARAGRACRRVERAGRTACARRGRRPATRRSRSSSGSMLAEQTRWAEGVAVVREALARADRPRARAAAARTRRGLRADGPVDRRRRARASSSRSPGRSPATRPPSARSLATAALITPVDTAEEHARAALLVHRTAADGARGERDRRRLEPDPRGATRRRRADRRGGARERARRTGSSSATR